MTQDKIDQLERVRDHLTRFIDDKDYRDELGRGFKGFGLSGDDILTLEAVTAYLAILKTKPAATHQLLDLLEDAEMHWGDALINSDTINGGDLVDWFAQWLPKLRAAMASARASIGANA